MSEEKKKLIKDVAELLDKLPENKQERAIGIMQGMILANEEMNDRSQRVEK